MVVNKSGTGTWQDAAVELSDWVFGNNGPSNADLVLLSLDAEDDIFHKIELEKLVDVDIGVDPAGSGSVQARHHSTVFDPPSGVYTEGTRLDLTATSAPGWEFSHWAGASASGNNPFFRLYPTINTQVKAVFVRS